MPAMVHLTRLGYKYAGKMHESMREIDQIVAELEADTPQHVVVTTEI